MMSRVAFCELDGYLTRELVASEASVVYVNVDMYRSKVELIVERSDGISTYSDDLYSDRYRIETNSKRCRVVHIR